MGRGRPPSEHKNVRVKVQNDMRTYTHIHKQISLIFNCVTPDSFLLASLVCQLLVSKRSE